MNTGTTRRLNTASSSWTNTKCERSNEERLIALERELAATKARAEMYETAVRANWT